MEFLYLLQLNEPYRNEQNWSEKENKVIADHFNYLKNLYEEDIVNYVGKTELQIEHPENTGLAVLQAQSQIEADALMSRDPAVMNGIMNYKLLPFRSILPWKHHS